MPPPSLQASVARCRVVLLLDILVMARFDWCPSSIANSSPLQIGNLLQQVSGVIFERWQRLPSLQVFPQRGRFTAVHGPPKGGERLGLHPGLRRVSVTAHVTQPAALSDEVRHVAGFVLMVETPYAGCRNKGGACSQSDPNPAVNDCVTGRNEGMLEVAPSALCAPKK